MYKWKDSFFAKAAAFLLVVICAVAVVLSAITVIMNVKFQWYSKEEAAVEESMLRETAGVAQDRIISRLYNSSAYHSAASDTILIPYEEEFLYGEKDAADFGYVIRSQEQGMVRFEDEAGKPVLIRTLHESLFEKEEILLAEYDHGDIKMAIYLGDMTGAVPEELCRIYDLMEDLYHGRNVAVAVGIISLLAGICLTMYLLVTAGKKEKPSLWEKIPVEVVILAGLIPFVLVFAVNVEFVNMHVDVLTEGVIAGLLLMIICDAVITVSIVLAALIIIAIKIRKGNLWNSSLVYKAYRLVVRAVKGMWGALRILARKLEVFAGYIPLVWKTALLLAAGILMNLFLTVVIANSYYADGLWLLWFAGALLTFAAGIHIAICLRRLKDAAGRLAEGDLEYKVDRKGMFLDLASCADDLNSIGEGMKKAVYERMKSERFKTELITNVSHDIKTPLTSIINYTDLLKKEGAGSEHADEYIEVIDRHSQRLKKMTEDLVEASKAAAGAVNLRMDRLRLGILMTQVAGEYRSRMEEQGLKLIFNIPDEEIAVMADGRYMQRVLDNILSNICKYAQPDTRVYQTLSTEQGRAVLTYKNISKEELNITADELMERFVRGDRSRNTEGSGLGLSIAKNLVELQGGVFQIEIDGDLFKAVISFPEEV